MLATTLGEPDVALTHLEHALERSRELGSPPLVARTQTEIARALLMRGADGDGAQARPVLEEAKLAATELGMERLAQEATGLPSIPMLETSV